jgi:hypothetical protein
VKEGAGKKSQVQRPAQRDCHRDHSEHPENQHEGAQKDAQASFFVPLNAQVVQKQAQQR